ncbi:Peptidase family M48 [Lishizhenia tianjinensis]|uniref:Peptidase family M48 n=1 Tax=Lishizhenia tianjinensis TaxID=477690 RepID=A0A1I6YBN0_9FLAO|nr:tetratricopeptide repeat protein [Lishizhenia tianjinensis]SFT47848.1 Peptidase family M48 [Lishizhenia tianjinensis]
MKKIIPIIITLCSYAPLLSQQTCAYSSVDYNLNICLNYHNTSHVSVSMNRAVDEILEKIGVFNKNFIVKNCNGIFNALATNYNNNRYILMDETFFYQSISNNSIGYHLILSHEIAHHLNGHTLKSSTSRLESQRMELECDYFAGFVLSKFGYNIEDCIKEAKNILKDDNWTPNSTHPNLESRITAIKKGYLADFSQKQKLAHKISNIIENEYQKAFNEAITNYQNKLSNTQDKRLAFLIDDAERGYRDIIINNKFEKIDEIISKYQKIDIITKEMATIKYQLGSLYYRKREFNEAYNYFISAYNLKNDINFLISAFGVSYEGGLTIDEKIFQPLQYCDFTALNHPNLYKYLAIYLADKKIERAITVLKYAIENWSKFNLLDHEFFLLPNLTSDLSLLYLKNNQLELAYQYNLKAGKLFDIENRLNSNLTEFDKNDFSVIMSNRALIEMFLEKYNDCITTCDKIITYLTDSNHSDVYYLLGRSYYGLGDYEMAVVYFNQSIKTSKIKTDTYYMKYYYRGLTNKELGNIDKSKIDFTVACDNNLPFACKELN